MKNFSILWALGFLILINGKGTWAWGGVFNRFSPEMLSNMGYGSHGGAYRSQPQQLFQVFINVYVTNYLLFSISPSMT